MKKKIEKMKWSNGDRMIIGKSQEIMDKINEIIDKLNEKTSHNSKIKS